MLTASTHSEARCCTGGIMVTRVETQAARRKPLAASATPLRTSPPVTLPVVLPLSAFQLGVELLPEPLHVTLLHDEDPVGPADVLSCHTDPRVMIRTCRPDLVQAVILEKPLGREAADPILAANEQDLLALGHRVMLASRSYPALVDGRVCA
jgi:hypothetical protein